jgi:hypothetical protein
MTNEERAIHRKLKVLRHTEKIGNSRKVLVLSRLRSGLPTHLCGLSFECHGAFAA